MHMFVSQAWGQCNSDIKWDKEWLSRKKGAEIWRLKSSAGVAQGGRNCASHCCCDYASQVQTFWLRGLRFWIEEPYMFCPVCFWNWVLRCRVSLHQIWGCCSIKFHLIFYEQISEQLLGKVWWNWKVTNFWRMRSSRNKWNRWKFLLGHKRAGHALHFGVKCWQNNFGSFS